MLPDLKSTRLALLAGATAMMLCQPAHSQEAQIAEDENGEEVMVITPDMISREDSQVLNAPADRQTATPDEAAPARPDSQASIGAPSLMAIFAHPDDEITIAPVLSRMARTGGNVTLVFATSGDVGPGVSGMQPGEELAALREDEARCAAFALGLDEPIFWQLGDGRLADLARAPGSAANGLAERISALIAIEQPDIVMTWGPDGGYGHADHRMVSNLVTQIVQAMGVDRPDLLYSVLPASAGGAEETPIPGFEGWARIDPSLATDRLRYELRDLDATRIAVDCYQSQFDATARTYLPELLHRDVWQGSVYFRLAFPRAE